MVARDCMVSFCQINYANMQGPSNVIMTHLGFGLLVYMSWNNLMLSGSSLKIHSHVNTYSF